MQVTTASTETQKPIGIPINGLIAPTLNNTEILELPSITQWQQRGAIEEPWIKTHPSKRPILTGERLPELNFAHSGAPPSPDGPSYQPIDQNYDKKGQYSKAGANPSNQFDIGLRTPSPSPTSQSVVHSAGSTDLTFPPSRQYPAQQAGEQYFAVMNQQSQNYMDAQHAMSAGQQYSSHSTTTNNMNQYPQYQHHQSPTVLSSGQTQYAQSPASYGGQYAYSGGMTSPHGTNQSVSTSMGHMNPGLPPLQSKHSPKH